MVRLKNAIQIGVIAGSILGLFLKWVEYLTSIKVYTLLLNIDFVPLLKEYPWGEVGEFGFHIIVSCCLSMIYLIILEHTSTSGLKEYVAKAIYITFPTILLYFPLSILSVKDVPSPFDVSALIFWALGHLLYSLTLAILAFWLRVSEK